MNAFVERHRGQILAAIVLVYVGVLVAAAVTGNPMIEAVGDVMYAILVVGFAGFVLQRFGTDTVAVLAAVALAGSGLAQLVALVTMTTTAGVVSTMLLLAGLGLYIYRQRSER